MSGEIKPALRRIRTYAEDLSAAQGLSAAIADTDDNKEPTVAVPVAGPTDKAAPAKAFNDAGPAEHIPAFHELQKKAASGHIAAAPKTAALPTITVRSKKHDLKEPRSASGGTIITDTKRNDLNFFATAAASVKRWFHDLTQANKKRGVQTYSVTDTELRKGVIQKATSKAGTIFTADAETLKDEIRRRAQTSTPHSDDSDLKVSWSPHTEAGYPLLPGDAPIPKVPERVVVEFKKRTLPQPIIVEPSPAPAVAAPEASPQYWEAQESSWQTEPNDTAPLATPIPSALPENIPVGVPPPPLPTEPFPIDPIESELEEEAEPAPKTETPAIPILRAKDWFTKLQTTFRHNTNALTIGIASVLLFFAVVAFTVQGIITLITASSGVGDAVAVPATPLVATAVTDLPLETISQEAVIAALGTKSTGTGAVEEFRLTDSAGVPLPLDLVLPLVGFSNNRNLNQTVTAIHLVSLNSAHGVIFTVTDAVSAFGALLVWEPTLLSSMSPLLAVSNVADSGGFVDASIGGTDVRILTGQGKELVTYGFITPDTVVITKDTTTFESLLGSR